MKIVPCLMIMLSLSALWLEQYSGIEDSDMGQTANATAHANQLAADRAQPIQSTARNADDDSTADAPRRAASTTTTPALVAVVDRLSQLEEEPTNVAEPSSDNARHNQQAPLSIPEDVGMSTERLARIRPFMQQLVDDGRIPGAITLVARRGRIVHFEHVGFRDIENARLMEPDTILRLYSQSKQVTGVAVMILYEEGKFLLSDPVSLYLPEFKDVKVLTEKGDLEDARPMTVKQLLTHMAGFTYWTVPGWERPYQNIGEMYNEAKLPFEQTDANSLEEWTQRLAQQPLAAQPGTLWHYSVAMDVLGRLVEVWSGQPLDQFLHERLFRPLGMHDTAFFVPPEKVSRFAVNYIRDEPGKLKVFDHPEGSVFCRKPAACSGGGGLVSTASDYYRFAQMLLNGGQLDGVRILGPRTVEYMMRDHLPTSAGPNPVTAALGGASDASDRAVGCGFTGFVVINSAAWGMPISDGSFFGGGAASTYYWIDRKEEMIVLVLSQLMMGPEKLHERVAPLVYQAIID